MLRSPASSTGEEKPTAGILDLAFTKVAPDICCWFKVAKPMWVIEEALSFVSGKLPQA